jgi:hypothetical protein
VIKVLQSRISLIVMSQKGLIEDNGQATDGMD